MIHQPLDYPLPEKPVKKSLSDSLGKWIIGFSLAYFGVHVVVAGVRYVF